MDGLFTDYVRQLDPRGEPPDNETFHLVWQALRAWLKRELNRRGLWEGSPSYLGVHGYSHWYEHSERGDALEELTADAYTYIFLDRLNALRNQLEVKDDIDGLVRLNIKHFVFERQRTNDPLGYRVFEVAHSALKGAVDAGQLRVLGGATVLRNDTHLSFTDSGVIEPDTEQSLDRIVPVWTQDLLPDLITARGKQRQQVTERLRSKLPRLHSEGIRGFTVKQLLDVIKRYVRSHWSTLLYEAGEVVPQEHADSDLGQILRRVQPEAGNFEAHNVFRALVRCVEDAIDNLPARHRTLDYLHRLWRFLCVFSAESTAGELRLPDGRTASLEDLDEFPSRRKLSELLDIPRDRLPELYATLGRLLEDCRREPPN